MTKKFIIEESFVSYADIEIYAENKDEALAKYHRGHYSMSDYNISDYKEDYTLLAITEEGENQPLETFNEEKDDIFIDINETGGKY